MSSFKEIYFPKLDFFSHSYIFNNVSQIWDPLKILEEVIQKTLNQDQAGIPLEDLSGLRVGSNGLTDGVIVDKWIRLQNPVLSKSLGILIGSGTVLEPTAIIKGPAIIGQNNDIRHGAYLRGNILLGDHCVIGHCTEVKNSLLMNHVEAGHFNYIGDSILGSYVNMGAGSRLANVQFRSLKEKMGNFISDIEIPIEKEIISTHLPKFGSIIGDNSEIGCNAVLSPGTLLGKDNWIYPNCTVPKGFYSPGHFLAPADHKPLSRPK